MTDAETRYAQIEKELLVVLLGMERFHQYTYGREVTVECDHLPIESIVKKPLSNCPLRLQRMLLRLQKYDFKVKYKPGSKMHVPDMLPEHISTRTSIKNSRKRYSVNCIWW